MPSWVENRLGDFNLWLTNLRVLKPGHASLDYRLRDREDLRNVIAGLLQSLHGFIEACRVPYEPSDSDHEVQGSDGSASAWSDVSDSDKGSEKRPVSSIFSDPTSGVESTLDRLIRLGMVIRKSGNKFRHELADRALDVSYYQDFKRHLELVLLNDANRHHLIHITGRAAEQKILTRATALVIKRRLLDPGQLTEFQQRAIHANIIRRNRFDFAKKRELKANPRDSEPMLTKQQPINAEHKATNLVPQTVVSRSQFKKYETKSQVTISHPSMVETATRVGTITTPVEPTPSKAATRITNMSSTGQNLDYPPCPQLKDLNDASFQCPFCCRQLPRKYLEKSGWRYEFPKQSPGFNWLFTDTYLSDLTSMETLCHISDCANKNEFYESKEEWMQHLRATHSEKYWQCPFPNICKNTPESRFTTESDWIHHMATHQTAGNQTRFSPTQLQIVAGTNTIHDCSIDRCPLCGFSSPANKGATIKHIAEHLHSFALRSLSWESYVDEDQSAATQAVDDKYTPSKTSDDSREVFESEDQTATASDDLDTYLDQFAGVITHWKSLVLNSNIPSYYKDIFKQVSRMADSLHASAKMRIEPIDSDAIRGMETGLLDICWIFKQLEEAAHSVFHDETYVPRMII
ncbi:hypothetical protein N7478_011817 [Penicillium angulare]|uniref:uncharacterized protein n=1 Tax=Penicillium angulare TaxID=116970 RepID=UPI00254143C5|nr:uncharacterized protein N7478_011817 [Penicillium angulare]KAJ5261222.1 hypothetical protein N7478_011817 [Penicillium angulare]